MEIEKDIKCRCEFLTPKGRCKRQAKGMCWQHSGVKSEKKCPRVMIRRNGKCGGKIYKKGLCYRHWVSKHLWD